MFIPPIFHLIAYLAATEKYSSLTFAIIFKIDTVETALSDTHGLYLI